MRHVSRSNRQRGWTGRKITHQIANGFNQAFRSEQGGISDLARLRRDDGRTEVVAHGTRDMPVWGETYTRELKYPGSMLSKEMTESMARVRMLALIEYISTLQGH